MQFLGKILAEIVSAIVRYKQGEFQNVNALIVTGIDSDLAEVEWSRIYRADTRPFLTAVFRAKYSSALAAEIGELAGAAFVALHNGHDDFRIGRADRQTDPPRLRRQSAAKFLPRAAAVNAFENTA